MIRTLRGAGARRLRAGLGARSQNRDVLGHGLLVVLAHGRSYQSGLALEALLRRKARRWFFLGTRGGGGKDARWLEGTLDAHGLDVGHAGPPIIVLLVRVSHDHRIQLLVGADVAGVLAA